MSYDLDKLARAVCDCSWCLSGIDCRCPGPDEGYNAAMKLLMKFRKAVRIETAKACAAVATEREDQILDCMCGGVIWEGIVELFPGVEDE